MVDLCVTDDVKNEIYILRSTTQYDSVIAERITKYSADIISDSKRDDLTSDNNDAKNACIYRVCAWLESQDIIPAMKRVVSSEREGDLSRNYVVSSKESQGVIPETYEGMYWYYFHNLLPPISVGCVVPDDGDEVDRYTLGGGA